MLRWRLLSSAVVLSILLSLLWVDYQQLVWGRPGVWLLPLAVVLTIAAAGELLDLLAAQNLRPLKWTTHTGTLLVVLAAFVPLAWQNYPPDCPIGRLGWPLLAVAAGIGLTFVGEMLRYRQPGGVVMNIALASFVILYLGLLTSFLVELRIFHSNAWGMAALVSMVLITKLSDTGAYFTGRLIGRHKMTPLLSPKKTIEGGLGGLAAGAGASWLFFAILLPRIFIDNPPSPAAWQWLSYGILVALAGMVGDLAESLIKRDMDRKDSSRWLPGLGGVLDMIDSLLFAAPVAYFCWAGGLVGPGAK